jgi:hypothetical protein
MAYTINGVDLGKVGSEKHKVSSNLDVQSFPFSASNETLADSYDGVKRTITVIGTITNTNQVTLMDAVKAIEDLQDGQQLSAVVYHSTAYDFITGHNGNINVKVDDFEWEFVAGIVSAVKYTLQLVESI